MTTKVSLRLAVAMWALSGVLILTNCNKPQPEPPVPPPAPAVEAPADIALPRAEPVAVRRVVAMTSATTSLKGKAEVVLNQGADVDIAVRGFETPQQFLATAYASKNLGIPFTLLKDKVVNKKMTLTRAISTTAGNVNAPLEAARAESEARADLARK